MPHLYRRSWLLRNGALVRWALGPQWWRVRHWRTLGLTDKLLSARRLWFGTASFRKSFWIAQGWLFPPRPTWLSRRRVQRRAAMRAAIRAGSLGTVCEEHGDAPTGVDFEVDAIACAHDGC